MLKWKKKTDFVHDREVSKDNCVAWFERKRLFKGIVLQDIGFYKVFYNMLIETVQDQEQKKNDSEEYI